MVGLLTALPQTRLWQRLKTEGRLEVESSGNNTDAALNFKPKLNRDFLQSGYRELVKKLYEPGNYYRRIRTFLKSHRPGGPRRRLSRADSVAFLNSFWVLGVGTAGAWVIGGCFGARSSGGHASFRKPSNWPSSATISGSWPNRFEDLAPGDNWDSILKSL